MGAENSPSKRKGRAARGNSPAPGPARAGTAPPTPVAGAAPAAALNPAALAIDDAARVLTVVGGLPVTREMLQADLEAGAPQNADGTINLVNYGAWLVQRMARHGD